MHMSLSQHMQTKGYISWDQSPQAQLPHCSRFPWFHFATSCCSLAQTNCTVANRNQQVCYLHMVEQS